MMRTICLPFSETFSYDLTQLHFFVLFAIYYAFSVEKFSLLMCADEWAHFLTILDSSEVADVGVLNCCG